jgi:hypothetical protein
MALRAQRERCSYIEDSEINIIETKLHPLRDLLFGAPEPTAAKLACTCFCVRLLIRQPIKVEIQKHLRMTGYCATKEPKDKRQEASLLGGVLEQIS